MPGFMAVFLPSLRRGTVVSICLSRSQNMPWAAVLLRKVWFFFFFGLILCQTWDCAYRVCRQYLNLVYFSYSHLTYLSLPSKLENCYCCFYSAKVMPGLFSWLGQEHGAQRRSEKSVRECGASGPEVQCSDGCSRPTGRPKLSSLAPLSCLGSV